MIKNFLEDYRTLMKNDSSAQEFLQAFHSVKEYVAAFSDSLSGSKAGKAEKDENTTAAAVNNAKAVNSFGVAADKSEESTGEETTVLIGGGIDLKFTELNALEGICLDEYSVEKKTARSS